MRPIYYPPFAQHMAPGQPDLMTLQRNVLNWITALGKVNPWTAGRLVTSDGTLAPNGDEVDGITFTGAQTRTINHGLGRLPTVVLVARDFGANAAALRENKALVTDATVTLTSTATCTVHLWVG